MGINFEGGVRIGILFDKAVKEPERKGAIKYPLVNSLL